jgi:hypothetical protein
MHRYGLWRSSAIPSLESERESQTPERAGSCRSWNLSHASRLDPHAAFPDTRSRFLNKQSVSKNVPDRNPCGLRLQANPTGGSRRVVRQFAWLEVDSDKMALSRPAHLPVTPAVETVEKVTLQKLFLKSGTETLKSVWFLVFRTTFWRHFGNF